MTLAAHEVALRIFVAFAAGAILGLEREVTGHQAGLRTHILVAIGACVFTLAGFAFPLGPADGDVKVQLDVTRVASQVVVGIGFLGGGSIIRSGKSVRGLTTAANLWVAAGVGLASGLGALWTVGFGVLGVMLTLVALRPVEAWLARFRKKHDLDDHPDHDEARPD